MYHEPGTLRCQSGCASLKQSPQPRLRVFFRTAKVGASMFNLSKPTDIAGMSDMMHQMQMWQRIEILTHCALRLADGPRQTWGLWGGLHSGIGRRWRHCHIARVLPRGRDGLQLRCAVQFKALQLPRSMRQRAGGAPARQSAEYKFDIGIQTTRRVRK